MSTEDKFFGVKTTIGGEKSDVDVEVVDDRPPEIAVLLPKRPRRKKVVTKNWRVTQKVKSALINYAINAGSVATRSR